MAKSTSLPFFRRAFFVLLLIVPLVLPAHPEERFLENGGPTLASSEGGPFLESPTRKKIDLAGTWLYSTDGSNWKPIKVPSAYDFVESVTFARSFEVAPDLLDKWNFKVVAYGINYECQITINDVFVGKHVGGYSSFAFQVPENALQIGQNNVIKVVVNNHLNASTTVPLRQQVWGWRNYGGIIRDIYILATPRVWIDDVQVRTTVNPDFKSATFGIKGTLDNSLADSERKDPENDAFLASARFRMWVGLYEKNTSMLVARSPINDVSVARRKVTRVETEFRLINPKLWRPENPELYLLKVFVLRDGIVLDEIAFEVGIRDISLKGSDVYLNGGKLFLQGVMWREDHPTYGSALTPRTIEEDFLQIKNLGANLVRVGNHPPHPYVLNLCDRLGLLLMEEIPVSKVPAGIVGRDYYLELARSYAREMVLRDRNHVSVFAWGIGDDFDSSEPAGKEYVSEIRTVIGALDDRPVYYATSMLSNDIAAEEVDFAAINIPLSDVKQLRQKLEDWKQKHPSQPTIVARYGKAVEPGNYNGYSDPMSAESQARYLIQHFSVLKDVRVAGGIIAAFADWRGDRPIMTVDSPDRFLSTMGLVSYSRDKRLAYEKVRAMYHNEKIPALPMGTYSENSPITFVLIGFLLLLAFAYLLKSHRRFRENVMRSFLRPYNFFADIRDQRTLSYLQSTALAVAVSITLALVSASIFYHTRNSESMDFILTHLMYSDAMKAAFSALIWHPVNAVAYFTLIFAVLAVVLAVLVRVFSFFVQSKVYFFHAYSSATWSALPIVLLIPVGMILYRVMESDPYVVPMLLLIGAILVWVVARLLKSISIIYDVASFRVYAGGLAVFLIVFGGLLAYYNYAQSTLAYYKFFVNFMQGSS